MRVRSNDLILLTYPPLLFAFILTMALTNSSWSAEGWGVEQSALAAVVAFALMGNFSHNFLSFWQLLRLQEFKTWSREYRFHGFNIWQLILIFLIGVWTLLWFLPRGTNSFIPITSDQTWQRLIIFLLFAINTHHARAQSMGIGIRMSHRYLNGEDPNARQTISKITASEKIFYRLLMADWFIFVGTSLLFPDSGLLRVLFWPRIVILTFIFAWITGVYLRKLGSSGWIKHIYNLRMTYVFFFSLHPVIPYLSYGLHGADAMLIYWDSLRNSKDPNKGRLQIEFLALTLGLGALYLPLYLLWSQQSALWIVFLLLTGIFQTHYLAEGFMYRMKNPLTRLHIGKILS